MNGKRRLLNWSLRSVLVLFLCASLVLTGAILLFSSFAYRSALRANTEQSIELYASEQQKLLQDEMQTIKTALYSIANKKEVTDYLNNNRGYKAANVTYITSLVSDIPKYIPIITDVMLVTPDLHIVAASYASNDMDNFLTRYQVPSDYYQSGQTTLASYTLRPEKNNQYVLAMAVPVQSAAITGLVLSFSTLDALLGNLNFFDKPCAILQNGELIYRSGSDTPDPPTLLASAKAQAEGAYGQWIHLPLELVNWDVFIEYPLNMADGGRLSGLMTGWNLITLLICALVECLLILAIQRTIIAPIVSISTQSSRIQSSAAVLDNPAPGRNELHALVQNLNAMIARTNQLTSEINAAKLRLMALDIAHLKERNMFLQAQINPHFLYNMLECICGMATQEGNQSVREMTRLLSRMYQYCLRSPESTLGEELESLSMYEKIIQLRYSEDYQIQVDLPEDLALLPVPRMILEPLVENAVQHGFERGRDQTFFIRVSGRLTGDTLEVRVADNGCGIPKERMAALNAALQNPLEDQKPSGRIGLYNVAARLRLIYDEQSGLALSENALGGLTVTLKIHYCAPENE